MEKMKIMTFMIILLVVFGCPDKEEFTPDITLVIRNNSNDSIVEYREYAELTDTIFQEFSPFTSDQSIELGSIPPQEEIEIPEETERLSRFGAIHIYIFDKDTLKTVSWDQIRDDYNVLRRYDLTLEDLEAMNWIIEYP